MGQCCSKAGVSGSVVGTTLSAMKEKSKSQEYVECSSEKDAERLKLHSSATTVTWKLESEEVATIAMSSLVGQVTALSQAMKQPPARGVGSTIKRPKPFAVRQWTMDECHLRDADVVVLAKLLTEHKDLFPQLTTLSLRHNPQIDYQATRALVDWLQVCPQVTELDLEGCPFEVGGGGSGSHMALAKDVQSLLARNRLIQKERRQQPQRRGTTPQPAAKQTTATTTAKATTSPAPAVSDKWKRRLQAGDGETKEEERAEGEDVVVFFTTSGPQHDDAAAARPLLFPPPPSTNAAALLSMRSVAPPPTPPSRGRFLSVDALDATLSSSFSHQPHRRQQQQPSTSTTVPRRPSLNNILSTSLEPTATAAALEMVRGTSEGRRQVLCHGVLPAHGPPAAASETKEDVFEEDERNPAASASTVQHVHNHFKGTVLRGLTSAAQMMNTADKNTTTTTANDVTMLV